jgi:hypothetical protein
METVFADTDNGAVNVNNGWYDYKLIETVLAVFVNGAVNVNNGW